MKKPHLSRWDSLNGGGFVGRGSWGDARQGVSSSRLINEIHASTNGVDWHTVDLTDDKRYQLIGIGYETAFG
jgi:hypothetical protein